jgi:ferric-dicitrate binding protein FerR (iron transport regulator)
LADGSKVWLNAASSLHFPTSFTGGTRTVEVSGEAYFEVAKNKDLPFIVKVNGDEIKVLGTSFNVNAYDDEELSRTTLLEGAIAFTHGNDHTLMRPGQQVKVPRQGDLKLISNVDIDEVIAWKRGVFHFESAGMEEVMRQLARWYDVDVVFKGKPDPSDHLYADIPRQNKLSDVIKALRIAGGVRIELEGKTITVY